MKLFKNYMKKALLKSNSRKWLSGCKATELEVRAKVAVDLSSISKSEVTKFPEYDPAPVDVRFDISKTYGEPLAPSGAIFYPCSERDPDSRNSGVLTYGSVVAKAIVSNSEKHQDTRGAMQATAELKVVNRQEQVPVEIEKPENKCAFESTPYDANGNRSANCSPSFGRKLWGFDIFSYGNGYCYCDDCLKASSSHRGGEGQGYNNGMEESTLEHGFDFHPDCLYPYDFFDGWIWSNPDELRSSNLNDVEKSGQANQWNETANYLFGFSHPYDEDINGSQYY